MDSYRLVGPPGDDEILITEGPPRILGRSLESKVQVHVYYDTISMQHAELSLTEEGVRIRDLDSRNGTFLNGEPIAEAVATAGDHVAFGAVSFAVERVA